jgi:hypothetical protein
MIRNNQQSTIKNGNYYYSEKFFLIVLLYLVFLQNESIIEAECLTSNPAFRVAIEKQRSGFANIWNTTNLNSSIIWETMESKFNVKLNYAKHFV